MTYRLKELRARHDLTQVDMAAKLGVTPLTYYRWEKNPKMIRFDKVAEIARILQVNITDIQF